MKLYKLCVRVKLGIEPLTGFQLNLLPPLYSLVAWHILNIFTLCPNTVTGEYGGNFPKTGFSTTIFTVRFASVTIRAHMISVKVYKR